MSPTDDRSGRPTAPPSRLPRIAALASSIALAAGFVAYQAGAFSSDDVAPTRAQTGTPAPGTDGPTAAPARTDGGAPARPVPAAVETTVEADGVEVEVPEGTYFGGSKSMIGGPRPSPRPAPPSPRAEEPAPAAPPTAPSPEPERRTPAPGA